jgi:hypothetical protein
MKSIEIYCLIYRLTVVNYFKELGTIAKVLQWGDKKKKTF